MGSLRGKLADMLWCWSHPPLVSSHRKDAKARRTAAEQDGCWAGIAVQQFSVERWRLAGRFVGRRAFACLCAALDYTVKHAPARLLSLGHADTDGGENAFS